MCWGAESVDVHEEMLKLDPFYPAYQIDNLRSNPARDRIIGSWALLRAACSCEGITVEDGG